jgi:protein-S-isoprenylcysteine O-methyltransferase Ste14
VAVLDLCWLVFLVVWTVGWVVNARRGPQILRRTRLLSSTLVIVVLLVVLTRLVPPSVFRPLAYRAMWLDVVGMVALVASTALTVWARAWLGTMWTAQPVVKQGHELRTDGPYAFTRHPIYTGLLGMLVGTVILNGLGFWLVILVTGVVFVEAKIRAEERLLGEEFGERYAEFRRRVPRVLPGPRSRLDLL